MCVRPITYCAEDHRSVCLQPKPSPKKKTHPKPHKKVSKPKPHAKPHKKPTKHSKPHAKPHAKPHPKPVKKTPTKPKPTPKVLEGHDDAWSIDPARASDVLCQHGAHPPFSRLTYRL